jgi:hypothetical protein
MIRKYLFYLIPIFAILMLIHNSCKKEDLSPISQYKGNWSGNYTGTGDFGTWNATINSEGTVSVSAHSNVFNENYQLTGNVNSNGMFSAISSIGSSFTGQFTENNVSGTWVNSTLGINGTWEGSKN